MLHLSFEEISDFVSMDSLKGENGELAARVLTHIRTCEGCREAVGGMLNITDVLRDAKRQLATAEATHKGK